ncbi:NAD(P)H-dependent oxidoreductase [cf. Phormidesmis sp. LEGE 11477]|uniref:NAD(P)H-dependent oxidoreductase n=1 Tax=cf. Phormidesmis sp. LEGE 11477 TaxID=1828680 RepID=UPI001882D4D2|nr:NAD(P)H-dependent oxidoreductase [cf. Phormidesmis sp. LEGE 11477]MBE9063802.1 NAD(P)H-dependent oxidoreductase [cf. Phormidesmis sp. LEGE 11477]
MNKPALSPDQVIETLNWRYATKAFDPDRKIPDDVWHALEQSLVLAPSSFGMQPWKFFVVRNPQIRQQLVEDSFNQTKVAEASHLVVLAIKKDISADDVPDYVDRVSAVRNVPKEKLEGLANLIKGYLQEPPFPLQPDKWSAKQVYLALGFFLYSAALLGIDTCAIEGFVPAKYDEILGLAEQGYSAVVLCVAGYRAEGDQTADQAKVRYETDRVVAYID